MKNYGCFRKKLILRDYLALDRTVLANERTLLAYIRTFIGLLSAGLGMIKLLDGALIMVVGWGMCVVSPVFLVIGIMRYLFVFRKLKILDDEEADPPGGPIDPE